MADLAAHLRLPVLIVARTRLGTINHTVLTAEALQRRGVRVLGVVFSRSEPQIGDEEQESMELALRDGALRGFGVLPFLAPDDTRDRVRLAVAVEQHLRVDDLLSALDA
jgi:dethiobiotin synthetase